MRELQNEHYMKSFGLQVAAARYNRQGVADHAPNLATKSRCWQCCGTSSSASKPSPVVKPSLSPPGVTESSRRFNGIRDSSPFNILSPGNPGSSLPSRQNLHSQYLGQTSRGPILSPSNSSHPSNVQSPLTQVPGIPRNLSFSSRNNEQHHSYFGSQMKQEIWYKIDPTNWSLSTRRSSSIRGNYRNDPVWMPHVNSGAHGQQRLAELPPLDSFSIIRS
ncbi:hypothetical protein L2E82_01564 [Cichorium intybus]|uniref:Uncharacterized protein n=1 Tax=Cichorium intybus TaxID=13427 RepID=A0ACB9H018_CICIN|nr:hypothetical protein L2E82_01564 [Cichorium intybus]